MGMWRHVVIVRRRISSIIAAVVVIVIVVWVGISSHGCEEVRQTTTITITGAGTGTGHDRNIGTRRRMRRGGWVVESRFSHGTRSTRGSS